MSTAQGYDISSAGHRAIKPGPHIVYARNIYDNEAHLDSLTSFAPQSSPASTFGPTYTIGGTLPDMTIMSSDGIRCHVHTPCLVRASSNHFDNHLVQPGATSITVPEPAGVLKLTLHIMYGFSCLHLTPSLDTIERSLFALSKYGAPVIALAVAPLPLYCVLMLHSGTSPIEVYALAGQHDLEEVAVAVSAHLLAYDTSALSDALAVKMGPVYFKRLLDLHQNRLSALKEIVLHPPSKHSSTADCDDAAQDKLTNAWAFAAAQLVWEARPNISTHALQFAFEKAHTAIDCALCRASLTFRIQDAVQEWSAVKRSI